MNVTSHYNYSKNFKKQKKNIKMKKEKKNINRNITYTDGFLKIATHNVRGFNNETKQKIFRTFYKEQKIDIIGITETKLNVNNGKICMNNIESYKTWWENVDENHSSAEVGFMVKNELAKHIYKVHKEKG
jgi:hypothetical protein